MALIILRESSTSTSGDREKLIGAHPREGHGTFFILETNIGVRINVRLLEKGAMVAHRA